MDLSNYLKGNTLILPISSSEKGFNEEKIIKLIPQIKRMCKYQQLKLKFNYKKGSKTPFLESIEEIINTDDLKTKYQKIYNYTCDYLDGIITAENYCDFIDGKCIANRLGISVHPNNGCCYQMGKGLCKLFKENRCSNKNSSCKFYMCSYLRSKGIKFRAKDIPQLKYFLNFRQKLLMKYKYFTKEEVMIEKLLKLK